MKSLCLKMIPSLDPKQVVGTNLMITLSVFCFLVQEPVMVTVGFWILSIDSINVIDMVNLLFDKNFPRLPLSSIEWASEVYFQTLSNDPKIFSFSNFSFKIFYTQDVDKP